MGGSVPQGRERANYCRCVDVVCPKLCGLPREREVVAKTIRKQQRNVMSLLKVRYLFVRNMLQFKVVHG